jgi:TatD-related deoxyribonuclease
MEVTDDHFHLDPRGRRGDAVREFLKAGGSRLVLVHKPYGEWRKLPQFKVQVATTLRLAGEARDAGACVAVVAAPHPVELVQMAEKLGDTVAEDLYLKAVDHCCTLVAEGELAGLGELGRPHFPVDAAVWEQANRLLEAALARTREVDGAAVLHTESGTPEVMAELGEIADRARFPKARLVKHYGGPGALEAPAGLAVSVIASRTNLRAAAALGTEFMLETDYLDDPARPGAVMGPRTVPRRTRAALEDGMLDETLAHRIHVELPDRVYGKFS